MCSWIYAVPVLTVVCIDTRCTQWKGSHISPHHFLSTLLSPLIPYGIHMEWIYSMDSMWNMYIPSGIYVDSTWNPHGIHMESMWNEYISWNPCGMNPFHIDFIHCFTINKHLDIIILY